MRIVQSIAGGNTAFDAAFKEVLRLPGIADRMLSGGQQQRVAIASGRVNSRAILPTGKPTGIWTAKTQPLC